MNKLHLNLEDLDVQTFHVMPAHSPRPGTVFGAETWNVGVSCVLTQCGSCEPTNPDVDCGGDNSYDCPSVQVAYCPSADYTCGCGGGGGRETGSWGDRTEWDPDCT